MPETRKYSDRAEYLKKAVVKRRKAIKKKAITYLGGKCIYCQYNKYSGALEFHHKSALTKEFGIGHKGHSRSWDKVQDELDLPQRDTCRSTQLTKVIWYRKRGELLEA